MIRVVTFKSKLTDFEAPIATMSWKQAEDYHKEGKAMLARRDAGQTPDPDEWFQRLVNAVGLALFGGGKSSIEYIKENFDLKTGIELVQEIHEELMKESGLRLGEVKAGEASPNSVPA
jgi:hypothetical protein